MFVFSLRSRRLQEEQAWGEGEDTFEFEMLIHFQMLGKQLES